MSEPIYVVSYDARWPDLFAEVSRPVRHTLGNLALRIDHIGSTAIPGCSAKPIIDIQISVASFEPLEAYREPLLSLGYVHRADNPDLSKRYFRERPGARRTHIHVRRLGSFGEQFALLFRDYLRVHPAGVKAYSDLKYQLAKTYRHDRQAYVKAKTSFIWEIMQKADLWQKKVGWVVTRID